MTPYTLDLSSLVTVVGSFTLTGGTGQTVINAINLSNLVTSGALTIATCSGVPSINLPNYTTCTGALGINPGVSITSFSCPKLITLNGAFNLAATTVSPDLTNFGAIGTTKIINGNIVASSMALSQASVDYLMSLLLSLDGTGGTTLWGTGKTINISGGTTPGPTFTGTTQTPTFVADYTTGTISQVINGSTAVLGAGTTWTSAMNGRLIQLPDSNWYIISSVLTNTTMTLATNYGGSSGGPGLGAAYKIRYAIVAAGTTATVYYPTHGFSTGDFVTVSGNSQTNFNTTATITVLDVNIYTYVVVSTTGTGTGATTIKREPAAATEGYSNGQRLKIRGATVLTN